MKVNVSEVFPVLFLMGLFLFPIYGQAPDKNPVFDKGQLDIDRVRQEEIKGIEQHFYIEKLIRGQVLKIQVFPAKIDVVLGVRAIGTDSSKLLENINTGSISQPETIIFEVPADGNYAVVIGARGTNQGSKYQFAGSYRIKKEIRSSLTDSDRQWIRADSLYRGATQMVISAFELSFFEKENEKEKKLNQALKNLRESESIWEDLNDSYYSGKTALKIGETFNYLEKHSEALYAFERAAEFFGKTKDIEGNKTRDTQGLAISTNNIGIENKLLGKNDDALFYCKKAILLFVESGEVSGQATAFIQLGELYDKSRLTEKSREAYETAFNLFGLVNDQIGQSIALNSIGLTYDSSGEYGTALDYHKRAWSTLPKAKDAKTLSTLAAIYSNMGLNYADSGKADLAMETFDLALKIVTTQEARSKILSNKGLLFDSLGERRLALKYLQESLNIISGVDNPLAKANTLNNIGTAYIKLKQNAEAIKSYNEALDIYKKSEDRNGQAVVLNNLGDAIALNGKREDLEEALTYYNRAFDLSDKLKDRRRSGRAKNNIGAVYTLLGEKEKALANLQEALVLNKIAGDILGEAQTLSNLMNLFDRTKNKDIAIFIGKLAVNRIQTLRQQAKRLDNEVQKSLLTTLKKTYQKLAELLLEKKALKQSLEVIYLYQDQKFFDLESNSGKPIKMVRFSPSEEKFAQRYQTEGEKFSENNREIQKIIEDIGAVSLEQTKKERDLLETKHQTISKGFLMFFDDLSKNPPQTDNIQNSDLSEIAEWQKGLGTLTNETKRQTVSIYTLFGEDNFHLLLVGEKDIKSFTVPIRENDLNQKAREFVENIYSLDGDTGKPNIDVSDQARELYGFVFKPIENELLKEIPTTILWNLDGNLRYVPINALHDGTDYLIRRKINNIVITRFQMNQLTQNPQSNWNGTGFATFGERKVKIFDEKLSFPELIAGKTEMSTIFKGTGGIKGLISGDVFADDDFKKKHF